MTADQGCESDEAAAKQGERTGFRDELRTSGLREQGSGERDDDQE
jgi:hypothetical protein